MFTKSGVRFLGLSRLYFEFDYNVFIFWYNIIIMLIFAKTILRTPVIIRLTRCYSTGLNLWVIGSYFYGVNWSKFVIPGSRIKLFSQTQRRRPLEKPNTNRTLQWKRYRERKILRAIYVSLSFRIFAYGTCTSLYNQWYSCKVSKNEWEKCR